MVEVLGIKERNMIMKNSYAKNTKYDGQVTYLLTCPDAIPASAAESARISLATN